MVDFYLPGRYTGDIMLIQEGKQMGFGNHLYQARKKSGLSQENVAEKLGVSRQTISKWETDETLPDIR